MFFWGIVGPPNCGIGATIFIGQEMLCLPYAEFFYEHDGLANFETTLVQRLLEELYQ